MKRISATMILWLAFSLAAAAEVKTMQSTDPRVVVLAWDANTESDLAGYKVYKSTVSGMGYIQIGTAPVAAQPTYTTSPLGNGTHYFVVTATNTAGIESPYSNEVSKTIAAAPAAPKGLRLWIQQLAAFFSGVWRLIAT